MIDELRLFTFNLGRFDIRDTSLSGEAPADGATVSEAAIVIRTTGGFAMNRH